MAAKMNPLPSLIRASARDAADMSMRAAGRSKWNEDDWNAMCRTHNRLVTACYGEGPLGCIRFSVAASLQKAGYLHLDTPIKEFYALIDDAMAA